MGSKKQSATGELDKLVDRLRQGRCVLCAGSRLTAKGDERAYRGLVKKLLDRVPNVSKEDAIKVLSEKPLAAAGFVRRHFGEQFGAELLKETQPQTDLSEAVKLFAELPFRAVVTTSYDNTFERAFTKNGLIPRVYTPADHEELRQDGKLRFVFKALGDSQRQETVVFSSEDVQSALADGGYRSIAHDLYRSRSFLFVGFDGQDPDLNILLDRVLSGAYAGDVEHYAVMPGLTQMEREELYAAYRIRVLSEEDATKLAQSLKDTMGKHTGEALPDDDDAEAWLALVAENAERQDVLEHLPVVEKTLTEKGDWEKLVEFQLGRIDYAPSAAERARILSTVADVFENKQGDLGKAFAALIAAYKETPSDTVWAQLTRVTQAADTWNELLAELTELVPTLDESKRPDGWVHIARLYGDKLKHHDYAITSVNEALKLRPDHADALRLKLDILRNAERYTELAETLYSEAKRATDANQKAALLVEQGELFESRLSDSQRALTSFHEALKADPTSLPARSALEGILRRRGDFQLLLEVFDQRSAQLTSDEQLASRKEAADLLADKLNDVKGAITRYEQILADAPGDLSTLRALERFYRQEGQDERYLNALAEQAKAVPSDKERAALYRRLASEWQEQPSGSAKAAQYLEKLLEIDAKSEDAFRTLEQIYSSEHNVAALVDTYRRHAAIVPGPIRGEIFAKIGAAYEAERDDAAAIEAYTEVEHSLPNHAESLAALSRLYERTGAYDKAVDLYHRRTQLAEVKSQKVEYLHKAGEIAAQHLGDAKAAEVDFVRALEIDPTYVPAMTELVEIYRKNGEFLKAAKLLIEAVPHTTNRLEKTRMLVEAGELYATLEDEKRATELYTSALEVDPEHVEAAERVTELLLAKERYAEAIPHLEMLARKSTDKSNQIERLERLGQAAQSAGSLDKAEKAYARLTEIDPTHLSAQRARARWLVQKEEFQGAYDALTQVLEHHGSDLPPSEKVELFYELGEVQVKLNNIDEARKYFESALEIEPTHRATLLAQVKAGAAAPESLIDAKKALLLTATNDEKVRLYSDIGDLYVKLENTPEALSSYREALELRPDDQRLLHKCLDTYVEQKQWPPAVQMLERLIAVERDASIRAKYKNAAGLIYRDELGRPEEAARLLAESLDDDPTLERSSHALEQLLIERQEYKELTRFYRKALKRLGADATEESLNERIRFWTALGDVCLEKLGERESAIAAYEVALTLDPRNLDRHKALADLFVQAGPDSFEKAIASHQYVLKSEKSRILSYRSLKHLYIQTGQREKSLATSYALSFLKKGEADDDKKAAELKAKPLVEARRPLNDETWARLQHPDEDRFLSALFSAVAQVAVSAQAQPHKQYNLQRKDAVEGNDNRLFYRTLKKVVANFNVSMPEVYVRPEQKEPIVFYNCIDKQQLIPVFVIGAPLLNERRSEREVAFELGRKAALLRPERFLRLVLPQPAQLSHIIDASIALSDESLLTGELQKTVQTLQKTLSPVQLEQVKSIGQKMRETGVRSDVAALAWLSATDLTASRAALLAAQDLESAARTLAAEPASATTLPATQRLLDLVWSSTTEEFFLARKHMGIL